MNISQYILLADLAKECGFTNRRSFYTRVKRRGLLDYTIKVHDDREGQGYGNKVSAVPLEHVELFKKKCSKRHGDRKRSTEETSGDGWFYAVQTMPNHKPGRVKLGYAGRSGVDSIDARLGDYRTILGDEINLLGKYPCKAKWMEDAAIHHLTLEKCKPVKGAKELFDFDSIEQLKKSMEKFFLEIMKVGQLSASGY